MGIGLMLAMFVSLGFLAVALAAPTWVLGLFNQDPAVVETGCRYLRIVCFSYPAVALTYLLSNVLRGTERVRLPLYVSIVTTIANAFADYGLIFGAFGLPRLGVEGAAIATCISSWLGPVLILIFSAFEKNLLVGPVRELLDFNLKQLGEFCARALPVMSNEGLWALGMLMLNRIYANMGYEYYAGMTIFKTFSELAFAFYVGLGNACVIMVGKSIGSGKIHRPPAVRRAAPPCGRSRPADEPFPVGGDRARLGLRMDRGVPEPKRAGAAARRRPVGCARQLAGRPERYTFYQHPSHAAPDILGLFRSRAPAARRTRQTSRREADAETGRNPLGCGTRGPARPVAAARARPHGTGINGWRALASE